MAGPRLIRVPAVRPGPSPSCVRPGMMAGVENDTRVPGDGQGPCGDDDCGIRELLDRLGDKWTVLTLVELSKGTRRFGELRRAVPGISQRMLTLTTKRLCRDGFVVRTAHPTIPPQVDYTITDLGRGLVEMGSVVAEWTRANAGDILAARQRWDAGPESSGT